MKQLYMCLLAYLLPLLTAAQVNFSTFHAPVAIADEIIPAVNPAGDVCLYTYRNGTAYFSTVNVKGEHVNTVEHPITFHPAPEMVGVLPLENQFIFFQREDTDGVESLQPACIDKNTGRIRLMPKINPSLDEKSNFVQAFIANGTFYVLYYSDKTNTMQVCMFSDEHTYVVKKIILAIPNMEALLFWDGVPVYVNELVQNPMALAQNRKKIYLRENTLVMTFDGSMKSMKHKLDLTTDILELNLLNQSATFARLPFLRNMRTVDMNSFLHQNTLFQYQMTKGAIILSAYDLPTQNLVKQYEYKLKDPLQLKASPVIGSDGKPVYSSDSTTVELTGKVIRQMTQGIAFVLVDKINSNTLQLSLGRYHSKPSMPFLISMHGSRPPSLGPVALSRGPSQSANRYNANYHPTEITTHFRTSLDSNLFNQVSTKPVPRLWDEVDKFTTQLEQKKVKLGGVATYHYQGQIHYAYLDRETETFQIIALTQQEHHLTHND